MVCYLEVILVGYQPSLQKFDAVRGRKVETVSDPFHVMVRIDLVLEDFQVVTMKYVFDLTKIGIVPCAGLRDFREFLV
jgi:hypothetical protein